MLSIYRGELVHGVASVDEKDGWLFMDLGKRTVFKGTILMANNALSWQCEVPGNTDHGRILHCITDRLEGMAVTIRSLDKELCGLLFLRLLFNLPKLLDTLVLVLV